MNWMVGIPAMFKEPYDKFLVIDQVRTKYIPALHYYKVNLAPMIISQEFDMLVRQ